jgi:PAS domain S-box-containing protein
MNERRQFAGIAADRFVADDSGTFRLRASRQQREAERLPNADEKMRCALAAAGVGVWEADLTTGVSYWNETCEAIHGLKPGTFGRNLDAFMACVHPEDRELVRKAIEEAASARRPADFDYRTVWPDGTERRINIMGRYFYDEAGVAVRCAGLALDVTDRRAAEEHGRRASAMEAAGRVAGGIAIDFNNVLTTILGRAGVILTGMAGDDPHQKDIEEIEKAGQRAARLTGRLLIFGRRQVLAPRILHLGDAVNQAIPTLRRLLKDNIELRTMASDCEPVIADAGQIEQLLVNLAQNASDAMPDGGRLTIETADVTLDDAYVRWHGAASAGPHVMLTLSDTGHGMDAATLRRALEPFFTTRHERRGAGMGLTIVHAILEQNGGHITLQSEVGRGSAVRVYLPRADEVDELALAPLRPQPQGGTETILVVEDEENIRAFVRQALVRLGYNVQAAADPREAIDLANTLSETIHLILTDVMLPVMGGRETAAVLRRSHPEARVLYMSGHPRSEMVHGGIVDPDAPFLQKPFTEDVLLIAVRDVLDAPPSAPLPR